MFRETKELFRIAEIKPFWMSDFEIRRRITIGIDNLS